MKSICAKITITIISLISMSALIVFSADITKKVARYQTAAISPATPGSEILAGSYTTVIDNLYATSGR